VGMQPPTNAVMDETQVADAQGPETGADDDGNITGNQLSLLFGSEPKEGAEDVQGDAEEVEDEVSAETESLETTEGIEEETVLSHSEDEVGESDIPKSTQKLLKQVSKLTARAKGAEEKVAEQTQELEALKADSPEDQAVVGGNTGIPDVDSIQTMEGLEEMRQKAMTAKRWALNHIGKDYVEDGEDEFDGDQIRGILRRSEDFLMEHLPARQAYLHERDVAETNAREDFPVWRGEDDEGEQLIMSMMNNENLMQKSFSQLPNQKYLVGLLYEGLKVVEARNAKAGKKPVRRPATPPSATEAVTAQPQVETRGGKKERKKLEALGTENVSARQLTQFFTD